MSERITLSEHNPHSHGTEHVTVTLEPGEPCPACKRRLPIPREDSTPRRRSQLNIAVPKDAEDGADVLRTLIEAAREKLTTSGAFTYDADCPPYYVLAAVLHDWLTA